MKIAGLRKIFENLRSKKADSGNLTDPARQRMVDDIFGETRMSDDNMESLLTVMHQNEGISPMVRKKMFDSGYSDVLVKVLNKPGKIARSESPGGLVAAGMAANANRDLMKKAGLGLGLSAIGAADMYDKTQGFTEPYSFDNAFYRQNLSPIVDQKVEGDKIIRTHEDGSISVIPRFEGDDEPIQPVSVLMAGGGPADSDNEPRFETRSPENQMFSIENEINNLMKSYNMLVESQEFDRAQQVATMIDQLQQQKIGIQAQNVPQQDEITRILDSISI